MDERDAVHLLRLLCPGSLRHAREQYAGKELPPPCMARKEHSEG